MRRAGPILILVIGVLALVLDFARVPMPSLGGASAGTTNYLETKLGLDLRGGLRIEYQVQPDPNSGATATRDDLNLMRSIIVNRVDKSGVAEPQVVVQGTDRIVVEMPGVQNADEIRKLVGTTGTLDFVPLGSTPAAQDQQLPPSTTGQECDATHTVNCVLFTGKDIVAATIGANQTGQRTVDFTLNDHGKQLFADYTSAHVGDYFAVVLDGKVITAPVINEPIPGGQVQISQNGIGGYPLAAAQNLVTILQFGSLEFPMTELANTTVSPTLGDSFLHESLLAGFIAVLMVVFFMVVHYRLPGIVASGALMYYALVVYALFRLIPVTLTLAGIAGFVLSVGMAVDANILIFERTKEELRVGKSLPAAIEAGFNRAWNSILDSNVSSLITATILFLFGSSTIRGFGLVLIIGVLVSMFTAITVTRTVLRIVVAQPWARRAGLYGVTEAEFLARPATGRGSLRGEARGRV
jgi:preprotein translocase subunit SecD